MKTDRRLAALVLSGVLGLTGVAAHAQNSASGGGLSDTDRHFIRKAQEDNVSEVAFGRVMVRKTRNRGVRSFAGRMVRDHSNASVSLKALAGKKGVDLPTGLDDKNRQFLQKISRLPGPQADRVYMAHMVEDHSKDVPDFIDESGKTNDTDVHNWVVKGTSMIQDHLKLAQHVSHSLNARRSRRR